MELSVRRPLAVECLETHMGCMLLQIRLDSALLLAKEEVRPTSWHSVQEVSHELY